MPGPKKNDVATGGASRALLAAGLAGLLVATGASCNSGKDDGEVKAPLDDSGAGGSASGGAAGAAGSAGAGGSAGAAGGGGTEADSAVGDAALADSADSSPTDATPKPDAPLVDCDGGSEGGTITASVVDPTMTLEKFTTECNALGGKLEIHPHCGGANSCKGMSYDTGSQTLTQHTCKGLNTCAGFSCVLC